MQINYKKHKDCLEDYMSLVMKRKNDIYNKRLEMEQKIQKLQSHIQKVAQQHEWMIQQQTPPPDVEDQDLILTHNANIHNLRKLHKQELQSF